MNFKADWSFLEKVSMGATASKAVINLLNNSGHDVIELERYSTKNKIWATKIKRLRMPDLICLKCGKRIESRAKSKLDVRMSDNENNPERRWDAGLRDEDLIAFIQCQKEDDEWIPANELNLFRTDSLRNTVGQSKLGPAKSAGEGAERDRIWKTTIPKKDGMVIEVVPKSPKTQIRVQYDDGKNYTYSVEYNVYSNPLDRFIAYSTMIAGLPQRKECVSSCSDRQYDFIQDLSSDSDEIRYGGVKALGYLPKNIATIKALYELLTVEADPRIMLEIYSSLIRLGENLWSDFYDYAMSIDDVQYKFEYILILGELNGYAEANDTLCMLAKNTSLDTEMRSAASWGIKIGSQTIPTIIEIAKDGDPKVVSHVIAHAIDVFDDRLLVGYINEITCDENGAVVQKILLESEPTSYENLVKEYVESNSPLQKKWIAMTIGLSGEEKYGAYESQLKGNDPKLYELIITLWNYKKFTVSKDESSEIEFLLKQTM